MADRPVVLISGASRGLGRALAEHWLERGHHVHGMSRGETALDHGRYHHHVCDVTDEAGVTEMMRRLRTDEGRLDLLINNAGIAAMNHALLTPVSTLRRVLDTNVCGTFLLAREAAKLMKRRGSGRIVNFSTVAVPLDLEGEAVYAASKAAVESLTRILARELAPMGITVNAVGPSPIRTDLIRGVPEEKLERLVARQALPRFGEARDVLNAVDFFARDESDFVTGQVLYLGGVS